MRDVEARYGAVPLRGVLRRAIRQGLMERYPLRPLGLIMMGALTEACFYVAESEDREAARTEVSALISRLLSGLATPKEHALLGEAQPGQRSVP